MTEKIIGEAEIREAIAKLQDPFSEWLMKRELKLDKQVTVDMRGLDKHELVQIMIYSLPETVRKIYGIALDERQAKFFELFGFKKESNFEYGVYTKFVK